MDRLQDARQFAIFNDWLRYAGKEFIEFIGENLKVGTAHFDFVRTDRGGKSPGTWAHWQIGLAYVRARVSRVDAL